MKILLKYPSRSRPEKFLKNLQRYILTLSGKHDIHIVISFDEDDTTCNNSTMKNALNQIQRNTNNLLSSQVLFRLDYFYGPRRFKIGAINRDIPNDDTWDFLVLASDDMEPVEQGWDDIFATDMTKYYPDFDGALNYNNDPRVEPFQDLVTLPVIGRRLYERFGYIYYPGYQSEFCDNEQTQVFTALGKLTHIDRRPIWHNWYDNLDGLMAFNMQLGRADKVLYEKRKQENFPP